MYVYSYKYNITSTVFHVEHISVLQVRLRAAFIVPTLGQPRDGRPYATHLIVTSLSTNPE